MMTLIRASFVGLAMAGPVAADPTFGIGLTMTFGQGQVNTGVGLRVFSDDTEDTGVGSLGLDYMFGSGTWRASIGAAYLGENSFIELNAGVDLNDGTFGVGFGVGGAGTVPEEDDDSSTPASEPETPPNIGEEGPPPGS